MAGPTSGTVAGASGFMAVMSFMPFGVSFETLVLGGMCFFGGACARTGLKLWRLLDGDEEINFRIFARAIAALLCVIPVAAVASSLLFLAAHAAKIQADAGCGGLLFIMGIRGPEGFVWLANTLTNFFTKMAPGAQQQQPADGK